MDREIGVVAHGCARVLAIGTALASSVGFRVFPSGCVAGFLIGSVGFFGFVIGLIRLYLKGASPPLLSFLFTQQLVPSLDLELGLASAFGLALAFGPSPRLALSSSALSSCPLAGRYVPETLMHALRQLTDSVISHTG